MKAAITILFLCANTGIIFTQEQCHDYKILPRDIERSQNNAVIPTTGSIPCDDLTEGWYRFNTGEIATSCVPPDHCGTSSPIWMRDAVPDTGTTQLNEFCVSHSSGGNGVCCLYSFTVNVTNCGGYLVYNFNDENILCPSGYCRGDLKTCPDYSGSPSGFEPCTWQVPAMSSSPVLEAPDVDVNGQDFTQSCNIMYNGSDMDAAFRVTWSFDGVFYKEEDLTNGKHTAKLTSKDWTGHFGETLSCAVESYFSSTGFSQHSRTFLSNSYFGGFMVSSKDVTLHEGQPARIRVKSTLPVVCPNTTRKNCDVQLDLRVTGPYRNEILIKDSCTMSLRASDWNETSHELQKEIEISSLVDIVFKPTNQYILDLGIQDNTEVPYFETNNTASVKLTTTDETHHKCYIVGSAQIHGFFPERFYAAGDFTGDCLMFKGSSSTGRELQVQTRLWRPNRQISATCGVAVQYGDVLIKVDMCSNDPRKAAPIITQGANDPLNVRVYLCNSDYEIVTADGFRLTVAVREMHLDVQFHVPPGYTISGEGACSFHDHHHWFEQKEFHNYRLYANTSFFAEGASPFMKVESSRSEMTKPYCECGSSIPICNLFQAVGDPSGPILMDPNGKMTARPVCHPIVPHALNPDLLQYPLVFNHVLPPTSYPNAQTACKNKVLHYSSHECVQNFHGGITAISHLCTEDVTKGHDDLDSIVSAAQVFQWHCQDMLLRQRARYSIDNEGHLRPPSSVSTDICYGLCSLHGTCMSQGVCACENGRAGLGCTVDVNKPPVIVDVKGGAHCPLSSQHCGSPTLLVRNVAPVDDLQVEVTVSTMYPSPTNHTFYLEAIFDNNFGVTVPMSNMIALMKDHTTLRLELALTMDGKTFSNHINYLIFDDKCQLCSSDGCLQKEDTCHIHGECYVKNELNPTNSSLMCDPMQGLVKWTEVVPSSGPGNPVLIG